MIFDLLPLVRRRLQQPVELVFEILGTGLRHLELKDIEMLLVHLALCIDELHVLILLLLHGFLHRKLLLLNLFCILAVLLLLLSFFVLLSLNLVHEGAYFAISGVNYVLQTHGQACFMGKLLVFLLNVMCHFDELLLGLLLILLNAGDLDIVHLLGHLLLQNATA